LLKAAWADLRATIHFFPLVRELVASSLKTENVGTVLGYLWWLLHPLMQMGAYVILVDVILQGSQRRFVLLVLTTLLAWKFFSAGVRDAINTTLNKEGRMRQIAFPKVVFPLSTMFADMIRFLVGLLVVLAVSPIWGLYPSKATPFLLVVTFVQLIFGLAFAVLFSALNFFLRDIGNFVTYMFPLWYYISPGLYRLDQVPPGWMHYYMINPFATLLPAYQEIILDQQLPNFRDLGIVFGGSCIFLVAAYLVFVRLQSSFAKVN